MASDPNETIILGIDSNEDTIEINATKHRELSVADATVKDVLYTILLEIRAMHVTLADGLNRNKTEISDAD